MADETVANGGYVESFDNQESLQLNEKRAMVEEMLLNAAFREELKEMVVEQVLMCANNPSSALTELLTIRQRFSNAEFFISPDEESVVPVCDIRGVDSLNYSKGEKLFRCKLASLYRLIDLFGWANASLSYVTACFSSEMNLYMVIPEGIWYDEVTAASLVKVDAEGQVLDPGSTGLGIDTLVAVLWHFRRPTIYQGKVVQQDEAYIMFSCEINSCPKCPPINRFFVHYDIALPLSVMKCGLLPLCPEAMVLDEITYLDFSDSLSIEEELSKLQVNENSKVLVLRNFGVFIIAETIEEAFYLTYNVMSAIDAQLSLIPVGLDNLHIPTAEYCQKVMEATWQPNTGITGRSGWRRGELEFEAMIRQLDSAGYCTGYTYHDATGQMAPGAARQRRAASDVGLAQSGLGLGVFGGSDRELAKFASPHRATPKGTKADGILTPNIYYKEECENKSTSNAKITKWLSESVSGRSPTPGKTADKPNPFAPQGINPAELKEKVKAIRRDYYSDRVSAGPQSRILDGITWDEAKFVKDGHVSGTGDNLVTMTASKGIIQREHQRHAVGFKKFEAPNPFNRMSEEEIEIYKQEVEKRAMTSSVERLTRSADSLDPGPDGQLISSDERLRLARGVHGEVTKQVFPKVQYADDHIEALPHLISYFTEEM